MRLGWPAPAPRSDSDWVASMAWPVAGVIREGLRRGHARPDPGGEWIQYRPFGSHFKGIRRPKWAVRGGIAAAGLTPKGLRLDVLPALVSGFLPLWNPSILRRVQRSRPCEPRRRPQHSLPVAVQSPRSFPRNWNSNLRNDFLAQRFARHASPLTTVIYTHASDEDLPEGVRGLRC